MSVLRGKFSANIFAYLLITTNTGLTVRARLDDNEYQTGKKAIEDFDNVHILRNSFHGE